MHMQFSPAARLGAAGAGVVLVVMVMLLVMQLSVLKDSRARIRAQDEKIATLLQASEPLLRSSKPLVDEARRLAKPLAANGEQIAGAVEALPRVESAAIGLAKRAAPALDALGAPSLGRLLTNADYLTAVLVYRDRLGRLVDGGIRTVPRLGRMERILASTLRVQRRTLEVQRQSLDTQLKTLEIQTEALTRIRSIDNKTGGPIAGSGQSP